MPSYLTPGVYLEVFETFDLPLRQYRPPVAESDELVETPPPHWVADHSTAAFIVRGRTGPVGAPRLFYEWRQVESVFVESSDRSGPFAMAVRGFFANGGRSCWVVRSDEDSPDPFDDALNALGRDVSAVCAPDLMQVDADGLIHLDRAGRLQQKLIAHCEREGDRIAVLDPPPGMSPEEVRNWRLETAGYDTSHAALYYPWIEVMDRDAGRLVAVPPCGHVAGVFARTDLVRGPHHTPANEPIREAIGVVFPVRRSEQAMLNPIGINVLAPSPRGVLVWGSRTLSSDPRWRHVRLRRLMNFIAANLVSAMQWAIFQRPDDRDVRARISRELDLMFALLWRSGALRGDLPEEAYRVRCDDHTNSEETMAAGTIVAECVIAPDAGASISFRVVFYCDG